MKSPKKPIPAPTRVRLEYTAYPVPQDDIQIAADKKISILRVILEERFGDRGAAAWEDWLLLCAAQQVDQKRKGANDAA